MKITKGSNSGNYYPLILCVVILLCWGLWVVYPTMTARSANDDYKDQPEPVEVQTRVIELEPIEIESPETESVESVRSTVESVRSTIVPENKRVYITKTGECYHLGNCGSLSKSKIPIELEDAIAKGYKPCGRCNPPS